MVGYSRHVSEDELGTLHFMSDCFDGIRILTRKYNGTLLKTMGDGALILFQDNGDAAGFGVEFHRFISRTQAKVAQPKLFRIGIHAGPVFLRNGDAFGHTVNIAARCLTKARPGCTIVSETVFNDIAENPCYRFAALGDAQLKNIASRFSLYQLMLSDDASQQDSVKPRLAVRLMGSLSLAVDGGPPVHLDDPVMAALVAYLTLCPGHTEHIEQLATLLLPDMPQGQAKQRIVQTYLAVRAELPDVLVAALVHDHHNIGLDLINIETDINALLKDLHAGLVPDMLRGKPNWPSLILSDLDDLSPVFSAWVQVMRDKICAEISGALEELLRQDRANPSALEDAADILLGLEPGHEQASEWRIRARLAAGNRVLAHEEYDRLASHLAVRFDMYPNEKLQKLMAASSENGSGQNPSNSQKGAPDRPQRLLRIFVLPFEGESEDSTHQISGFRDELMSNLARFRDWSIMNAADDAPVKKSETARSDYVLAGSSTDTDGALDLMIKLTSGHDNRIIWSAHFQLDHTSWAQTQRQVIAKIAASLEIYISTDRLAARIVTGSYKKTTHDKWLAGDRAALNWTQSASEEAKRIFREIIQEDPTHAPSLTSLAVLSNTQHITTPGLIRNSKVTKEADAFAQRAVKLDPMDARNHRAVAWSAAMCKEYSRAMLHFDLAIELNPISPETLASCAMGFVWLGEKEKAQPLVTQLFEITHNLPGWLWCYLASVHFFLGRYDDAISAAELSGDAIIDNQAWAACSHAMSGDMESAGSAYRKLLEEVAPVWAGKTPLNKKAVFDWLVNAYPIRKAHDRKLFADALQAAMQAA